jgi:hypothetical protein
VHPGRNRPSNIRLFGTLIHLRFLQFEFQAIRLIGLFHITNCCGTSVLQVSAEENQRSRVPHTHSRHVNDQYSIGNSEELRIGVQVFYNKFSTNHQRSAYKDHLSGLFRKPLSINCIIAHPSVTFHSQSVVVTSSVKSTSNTLYLSEVFFVVFSA